MKKEESEEPNTPQRQLTPPVSAPFSTKPRRKRKAVVYKEEEHDSSEGPEVKKVRRQPAKKAKVKILKNEDEDDDELAKPLKKQNKGKASAAKSESGEEKPKRRRKTKAEREAEMVPLRARTKGVRMLVGAHVSIAKGMWGLYIVRSLSWGVAGANYEFRWT